MKLGFRFGNTFLVLGACLALSGTVIGCGDDDTTPSDAGPSSGTGGAGGKTSTAGKGGAGGKSGNGGTAGKTSTGGTGGTAGKKATGGTGGTAGKSSTGGTGGGADVDAGPDAG